jgi:hypothetical protein
MTCIRLQERAWRLRGKSLKERTFGRYQCCILGFISGLRVRYRGVEKRRHYNCHKTWRENRINF